MDIQQAVNIGPKLSADLRKAGIDTLETLQSLGVGEAWRRLQKVAPHRDCTHACLALGGAIRGERWMRLPEEEKKAILREAAHSTSSL
jgi:DNA transformation protein